VVAQRRPWRPGDAEIEAALAAGRSPVVVTGPALAGRPTPSPAPGAGRPRALERIPEDTDLAGVVARTGAPAAIWLDDGPPGLLEQLTPHLLAGPGRCPPAGSIGRSGAVHRRRGPRGRAPDRGEPPELVIGTDLDEHLRSIGATNLVLAGFMTHMCVNSTARGAFDAGFAPSVVAAATATRALPGPDGDVPASALQSASLAGALRHVRGRRSRLPGDTGRTRNFAGPGKSRRSSLDKHAPRK
jgi:hypothetical protein